MSVLSARVQAANDAAAALQQFYFSSRYATRRHEPGISDFTFGNPPMPPLGGIGAAKANGRR